MSLGLSLNNALSGLKASQQAISTLSHNIANANTDGYSRQVVDQSALYIDGVGSGVRVNDVVRKVDKYLARAVQTQGSEVARTGTVNDYYQRINVVLGQPGSGNTLDEFVTDFFNSIQSLSETPDRASARSDVIGSAQALAGNISGTATQLQDLRFQADQEMRSTVDSINAVLGRLDKLNNAINSAGAVGQSTAGLLDERDKDLRELSGYMDITTTFSPYGAANVITPEGVALVDGMPHRLQYIATQSVDQFTSDSSLNNLMVYSVDAQGKPVGNGTPLISGGTTGNVTSLLHGGSLEGLRMMRDDVIPAMLDQMDQLASNLRDAVNTIHNDGSGFPAATSLTGTRAVSASQTTNWVGTVRIAVLNKDGTPVSSGYTDEANTGIRPLTLDLGNLNSGDVNGNITMQSIVDEINNHFAAPGYKAELGNINNIRLVSDSTQLVKGIPSTFNFDLEVENISGHSAPFYVGGITVKDDGGNDITNVTQSPPQLLADPTQAYYTTAGIPDVTINLLNTSPGIQVGDTIYLGPPGTPTVGGIPAADITGYFTVVGAAGGSITVQAHSNAGTTGPIADASGVYLQTTFGSGSDGQVSPGETMRTRDAGQMQVNLGASPNSSFYDITVSVATLDENGNLKTSDITYRVPNDTRSMLNDRFDATAVTNDGTRVTPQTTVDSLHAMLVDAKGNEIRKENGRYIDQYPSYLKIYSPTGDYTVAIDEMDSQQVGQPPVATNWGFSHYFGLNDFFVPNQQSDTGDTVRNSALHLAVSQRLVDNPNLITTGDLTLSNQPTQSGADPLYTYQRYSGDNTLATRLKALSTQSLNFDAAGGLPSISLTLGGYTSQMLGNIASNASAATDAANNAQTLYDGFKTRSDAITGVNLDEELANTVIFQNSYAATARIVTVVNQMFEDILQMV